MIPYRLRRLRRVAWRVHWQHWYQSRGKSLSRWLQMHGWTGLDGRLPATCRVFVSVAEYRVSLERDGWSCWKDEIVHPWDSPEPMRRALFLRARRNKQNDYFIVFAPSEPS